MQATVGSMRTIGRPECCIRALRHKSAGTNCRLTFSHTRTSLTVHAAFSATVTEQPDAASGLQKVAQRAWAWLRKCCSMLGLALIAWLAFGRAQASAAVRPPPKPPAASYGAGVASITAAQQPLTSHSWKKRTVYSLQKVR